MNKITTTIKKPFAFLQKKIVNNPIKALIITMIGIMLILTGVNHLGGQETPQQTTKEPIEVATFTVGQTPNIQTQALIKKNSVISIQAQTAGIVQKINVTEGDKVRKGTQLISISTNYAGETIATSQRQLAQKNLEFTQNNYLSNKNIIQDQKNIAEQTRENTEQLRQIAEKSAQETNDLLNLNNELMKNIQDQIEPLQQNTNRTADEETLLNQLKSQQAQLSAGINQLRAAFRANDYQSHKDNPPTQLANIQKELTRKQLDIQEKSLDLQLDIAKLNYQIATITESFNRPVTPYSGIIQRIHVTPGQNINPGQTLFTLLTEDTSATAEITVPQKTANIISRTQPGSLQVNNIIIPVEAIYIPTQPTDGSLTTIKFIIPPEKAEQVTHNSYAVLELPIGEAEATTALPFIPIDAIFQTQDGAYVYVVENQDNKTVAKAKKIIPGEVFGKYVLIQSGIANKDKIILNRNILEGDQVKTDSNTIVASNTL